jgi:hypothetical protein
MKNETELAGQMLSTASVGEIVEHLREGCGDFCIDMPSGNRLVPEEVWIPGLGCWLRTDGTYASFDLARGGVRFRWHERIRIRSAMKRFRELVEKYPDPLADIERLEVGK